MIHDIWPHRYDVAYQMSKIKENDYMLVFQKDRLLCQMNGSQAIYPTAGEILEIYPGADIDQTGIFLFRIDDKNYFGMSGKKIFEFEDWMYLPKGKIRKVRPIWQAYAGITGFQIYNWYVRNRFCGCCGAKMEPCEKERALQCTVCKEVIYPKICPSIIAGVINGERLLMAKYAANHSNYKKYALIAGYVEIGESLEDAVRREIMEEVGLRVRNIRYYKSQPWAFSDALLVGFFCEAEDEGTITMDTEELSVAEWFDRRNLPADRSESEISLTGEMIEAFRDGLV